MARAGSALRAARALKVNQTTVMRRVAHIEAEIGAELFEAQAERANTDAAGAKRCGGRGTNRGEVVALQSTIAAQQRVLSGSVRFTSSEAYANRIVAPCLKASDSNIPNITVEFITDDRRLDSSRGEADVALRAGSRPEGGGIVAQRLPDASWALYCSHGYAEEHGAPESE